MKNLTLTLFAATVSLLLASCATKVPLPKGNSDGYSTFRFYNPDVSKLPVFADRTVEASRDIQQRLQQRLEAAGLTVDNENPDLIVAHLLVIQDNVVTGVISDYYMDSGSDILEAAHKVVRKGDFGRDFLAGTLVVDVIDVDRERLIYRDYATRDVVAGLEGQERLDYINGVVDEAIESFIAE